MNYKAARKIAKQADKNGKPILLGLFQRMP